MIKQDAGKHYTDQLYLQLLPAFPTTVTAHLFKVPENTGSTMLMFL